MGNKHRARIYMDTDSGYWVYGVGHSLQTQDNRGHDSLGSLVLAAVVAALASRRILFIGGSAQP